jgi:hypothetical protein
VEVLVRGTSHGLTSAPQVPTRSGLGISYNRDKMHFKNGFFASALFLSSTFASPINDGTLRDRNKLSFCDKVKDVVDALKVNKATSFCSSYLHIATITATVVATKTEAATAYATVTSTRYGWSNIGETSTILHPAASRQYP